MNTHKTIITPYIHPIEEGTTRIIWDEDGLYLFSVTTWGVAPNGNALLIEKLENQTLLDIMHLPLNLHVETMEENKETGEITIYHQ
tara:strand:- start:1186 stop:1443 length:258 start_codon:yes stop_codon:yes gene_type:complete